MFVNLLDLNDNDPTFQNLPFVAEVLEGTPAGVSVYQVGVLVLACVPAASLCSSSPNSRWARVPHVPAGRGWNWRGQPRPLDTTQFAAGVRTSALRW